jgi:hypothetical protein
VTAGVKQPSLDWLVRADPSKSYAMCITTPVKTVKDGIEALVLVPPETQLWQKVGVAAI